MESESKQQHTAIESVSNLFSISSKLAGGAVTITGLAYLAGWQQLHSYYVGIGAPWAAALLSPTEIAQQAIPFLTPIFAFVILVISNLLSDPLHTQKLGKWELITIIGGVLALVLSFALSAWAGPTPAYYATVAYAGAISISAALSIGQLIGDFAESGLKWNGVHVRSIHTFIVAILISVPPAMGNATAKRDISPGSSKLASVRLSTGEKWQLVALLSGQALLVQLSSDGKSPSFKLASPSEIAAIDAINP